MNFFNWKINFEGWCPIHGFLRKSLYFLLLNKISELFENNNSNKIWPIHKYKRVKCYWNFIIFLHKKVSHCYFHAWKIFLSNLFHINSWKKEKLETYDTHFIPIWENSRRKWKLSQFMKKEENPSLQWQHQE